MQSPKWCQAVYSSFHTAGIVARVEGSKRSKEREDLSPSAFSPRQESPELPRPTHTINCYYWHHRLSGHEFEQTPRDGEGQGTLACCRPWGHRVGHHWRLSNNNNKAGLIYLSSLSASPSSLRDQLFRQTMRLYSDRGKSQNNFVEVRMSGSSVKQRRGGVEGVNYKATIL